MQSKEQDVSATHSIDQTGKRTISLKEAKYERKEIGPCEVVQGTVPAPALAQFDPTWTLKGHQHLFPAYGLRLRYTG